MQIENKKSLFPKLNKANENKTLLEELEIATKSSLGLSFILTMKNWVLVNNDPTQYDWMEGKK